MPRAKRTVKREDRESSDNPTQKIQQLIDVKFLVPLPTISCYPEKHLTGRDAVYIKAPRRKPT